MQGSPDHFHPSADELVEANAAFADRFDGEGLALRPRRGLAVVACMDSRMDVFDMLGLAQGDAHVIRNAGGVITDDVIRSLVVSQRFLGTQEVVLVHHTDCGLQTRTEDQFKAEIEAETGMRPPWSLESFADPFADVRQSMNRLRTNPFLPHKDHIRGFVFDVATGLVHEVDDREPGEGDDADPADGNSARH